MNERKEKQRRISRRVSRPRPPPGSSFTRKWNTIKKASTARAESRRLRSGSRKPAATESRTRVEETQIAAAENPAAEADRRRRPKPSSTKKPSGWVSRAAARWIRRSLPARLRKPAEGEDTHLDKFSDRPLADGLAVCCAAFYLGSFRLD